MSSEQLIYFLLNVSALFRGSCQYSLMLWLSLDQRTCPVQAVQQLLRLERACSFYAIHMNIFLIWTFYVPSIGYAKLIFSASNSEVITPATVSWENTDSVNDIAFCCFFCFLLLKHIVSILPCLLMLIFNIQVFLKIYGFCWSTAWM